MSAREDMANDLKFIPADVWAAVEERGDYEGFAQRLTDCGWRKLPSRAEISNLLALLPDNAEWTRTAIAQRIMALIEGDPVSDGSGS